MAITVNTGSPLYYAQLFGVDHGVITKATTCGVSITQSNLGYLNVGIGGKDYGNVAVKGSAITLAKAGTLGPASKSVIKHQLEVLMVKAINDTATTYPDSVEKAVEPTPTNEGLTTWQKATITKAMSMVGLPTGGNSTQGIKAYVAPELKDVPVPPTQEACSLYNATTLNQPVSGTSANSTYYLVAKFKGCNVAVRRTKSKLSVRAEGSGLDGYMSALSSMGMAKKDNYASVHYEVNDMLLVRKAIGSLIGAMGIHNLIEAINPDQAPMKG